MSENPEEIQEATAAEQAEEFIPGGTSTGSKRYAALYGDGLEREALPFHYSAASGCHLSLPDGRTIVDCTMALGSVAIGYGDEMINRNVMAAIGLGNVSGLTSRFEVEVAARLSEFIPCAEQVRFLKTGAEATAAAVRIARVATGRSHVVGSGYFGWLDWCSSGPGVPSGVTRDYTAVPFDDLDALEAACTEHASDLAAVILEPVVEHMPQEGWIQRARELCDKHGALLILDEIKTGFRIKRGGYQELSGVTPDLATFGKALANGFPLGVVAGSAAAMAAARESWISSTLASETSALAAALAVLELHEQSDICAELGAIGSEMRRSASDAVEASGITGVKVAGIDHMWYFHFDNRNLAGLFVALAQQHDVLFKRGAYNFPALAHDEDALRQIEFACSTAIVELRDLVDSGDVEADAST